jgi:DNA-binding CsgD family transcriptional regulator
LALSSPLDLLPFRSCESAQEAAMTTVGEASRFDRRPYSSSGAGIEADMLRTALDALTVVVLILGPDRQVQFCNRAAARELAEGPVLRVSGGRLVGSTPASARLLVGLRRWAQSGRLCEQEVLVTGSDGGVVHVSYAELGATASTQRRLLLLLRRPAAELKTPLAAAAALYRLTSSEKQILGHILNGRTLAEIAELLGVARSTVKSHLQAIYRKTDTHRQADLVRLTGGLTSILR